MTDKTAKEVFDLLLNEIRANGFTDVGTFMIEPVSKENEFEEFDDKYKYVDTDTAIATYEAMSSRQQGGIRALRKLIDASLEYFTMAYQIPDKFSDSLKELNVGRDKLKISFLSIDEKAENVDSILKGGGVMELMELLKKIRENMEQDDEEFFNSL